MPILNHQERQALYLVFLRRFRLGQETITLDEVADQCEFTPKRAPDRDRRWGKKLGKLLMQRLEDNGAVSPIGDDTWRIESRVIELVAELESPDRLDQFTQFLRRHPLLSYLAIAVVSLMFLASLVNGTMGLIERILPD